LGLSLTALTPRQPVPWYSKAALTAELAASGDYGTQVDPTTSSAPVALPDDTRNGWSGLGWILLAMVPASIGGGLLQPSLNSLITKRVRPDEIGGMLGLSASALSAANALAPLLGGTLFQWLGPSAPFLAGGLLMALLLLAAAQWVKPGRDEQAPPGLARGGAG
jgi:MFS transporter, DHA1 family, tetracycline resistance protein